MSYIHASESTLIRDWSIERYGFSDIEVAINLGIDAIIHATHADEGDIELMEENHIAVILCLTSNRFTKTGTPQVANLIDSEILLGIGTDNAMINSMSMWNEMKEYTKYIEDPRAIVKIATINPAKICNIEWGIMRGKSNFLLYQLSNHVINVFDEIVFNGDPAKIINSFSDQMIS